MAEENTFTVTDQQPETEVLTEEEQDSLAVGEKLVAEQENLLAGKYKSAQELEKAYKELEAKLGDKPEQAEPEPAPEPAPIPEEQDAVPTTPVIPQDESNEDE